jgi:hypothetical protein
MGARDLGEVAGIVKALIGAWLFFMIAIVVFRMATGGINLIGLLRLEQRAPFGLERVQLVAVTLMFAIGYTIAALYKGPGDALPRIPTPLLIILAGSNGAYLAVKFAALRGGNRRGE